METKNTQVNYSTLIKASKEKVWDTMLQKETYREWTGAFAEGSDYQGSWDKGSKILFLNQQGEGMFSKIAENKPYQFISIEHLGYVKDGKEDVQSQEAKAISGAYESYTFTESDGITEVSVDLEIPDAYKDMFDDSWPKALTKLKELSEK